MTDAVSLQDQIVEVELWMLGLRDFVQRFTASRKRPEHEIENAQRKLVVAKAVVATLRGLEAEGAR